MAQHGQSVRTGAGRAWRGLPRLALLLAAALPPAAPARAQTLAVSGACAQQCGAVSRLVRENRPEIQACLIRCNASHEFDRGVGVSRPAPPGVAGRYRSRPGNAPEATEAAASRLRAVGTTAPPSGRSRPYAAVPPAASPAAALPAPDPAMPQMTAASPAAIAAAAPARRWGAIYLAAAPAVEFGLVVGIADRLSAHAQAQSACGAGGAPCRPALEFSDHCGAVAQARRTLGLFRTADPRTYSVSYAAAGAGPTRDGAESAALAECRAHERSTSCEIAASACGWP